MASDLHQQPLLLLPLSLSFSDLSRTTPPSLPSSLSTTGLRFNPRSTNAVSLAFPRRQVQGLFLLPDNCYYLRPRQKEKAKETATETPLFLPPLPAHLPPGLVKGNRKRVVQNVQKIV